MPEDIFDKIAKTPKATAGDIFDRITTPEGPQRPPQFPLKATDADAIPRFLGGLGDTLEGALSPITHPQDTATFLGKEIFGQDYMRRAMEAMSQDKPTVGGVVAAGLPILGPTVQKLAAQYRSGDVAGVAGGLTGFALPELVLPKVRSLARELPGRVLESKPVVKVLGGGAERMAQVPSGGPAISGGGSRLAIAQFAKDKGIDLLPGQATEARPLRALQAVGERALFGGEGVESHLHRQRGTLAESLEEFKNKQAPGAVFPTRESIGEHVQGQTAGLMQDLKSSAQQDFADWREKTGGFAVDMSPLQEKYQAKLNAMKKALDNTPTRYAAPIRELLNKAANFAKTPEETVVIDGKTMKASELNDTLKKAATGYQSTRPGYAEAVDDAVRQRMETIRQDLSSGGTETTGKAKTAVNPDNPNDIQRLGRMGGGFKLSFPELDGFAQTPKIIADAIAKGDTGPLYKRLKEATRRVVEEEQGPAIHEWLDGEGSTVVNQLPGKPAAPASTLDVNDLQQLRTAFWEIAHDFEGNLPKRHNAIASEIVADLDQAMEQAATQAGTLDTWRQANAKWKRLETLYNTGNSPLAKILKQSDPTKVPGQLLQKGDVGGSPRSIRLAKNAGVDLDPIKRQVVQDILETSFRASHGGNRLGGYTHEFLGELFSPEEMHELYSYGRVGRAIRFEANPSGTSDVREVGEQVGALARGAVRTLLGRTGAAKLTLNPKFAEAVTGVKPSLAEALQNTPARRGLMPRRSLFTALAAGNQNRQK